MRLPYAVPLALVLLVHDARAAGANPNWNPTCDDVSVSGPKPGGRTFYVSSAGVDPNTCPPSGNYTFRSIPRAMACAAAGDTIYVRAGIYPNFEVSNRYYSNENVLLVSNYPGESVVIQPLAGTVMADYKGIVHLENTSGIEIQGFEIRNTGKVDSTHGGLGVYVKNSHEININNNTIHDTFHHGILVYGHHIAVTGNEVYRASLINSDLSDARGFDAAVAVQKCTSSFNILFYGNVVHDSYGECVDFLDGTGSVIHGNRIYNCHSVNLLVANASGVMVERNWIYTTTDAYNRAGNRAEGIQLSNEGGTCGQTLANITIVNNIIETTGNGLHYWKDDTPNPGGHPDTYSGLIVNYNAIRSTRLYPLKFDPPAVLQGSGNQLKANIVVNDFAPSWLSLANWTNWSIIGNYNYSNGTTPTQPGWVDPTGGWPSDFQLRNDSALRNVSSDSYVPADDFFCASREGRSTHSPGVHEWGAQ